MTDPCPSCAGDGRCPLCVGTGTVAPVLAALHVETIEQNTRLAARNTELTAALKAVWDVHRMGRRFANFTDADVAPEEIPFRDAWRMVRDALGSKEKGGGA